MRRYTKALLPALVALLCAGTAQAHIITVEWTSGGFEASDTLVVDVMLDSEEEQFYGFTLYLDFEPTGLSPSLSSTRNSLPGEDITSLYLYPNSWYIRTYNTAAPFDPVNTSIATLVFHVVDSNIALSSYITPVLDRGEGVFVGYDGSGPVNVTDEVSLVAYDVPEPGATILALSAICTLACLWRRRGRAG